jgi:ATP-binding cassette subfamily B multidrug efflux pump
MMNMGSGWNPNLPGAAEVRRIRGRLSLVLEDMEFGHVYDQNVIRRLFVYLKPHWKLTLISMIAMLLYIGTQISVPLLVGLAINQYIGDEGLSVAEKISGLNTIAILFAVVAVLNLAGNFFHLRGLAKVNMSVLYKLRTDMHAHLQRLSTLFYDHNEVGRLMSRVQSDTTALQEFMTIFVVGFAEILSLIVIVIIMLAWNFQLALICFTVIPIFMVIMLIWQKRARLRHCGSKRQPTGKHHWGQGYPEHEQRGH